MRIFLKFSIILFFLLFNSYLSSNEGIEEKKMRDLAAELRCVVCQNQSLLESDSEIAKDLKNLILEMYLSGKSTQEIKSFLVDRYGEFILFKPKINKNNLILWFAPIFSLLIILLVAYKKLEFEKKKK